LRASIVSAAQFDRARARTPPPAFTLRTDREPGCESSATQARRAGGRNTRRSATLHAPADRLFYAPPGRTYYSTQNAMHSCPLPARCALLLLLCCCLALAQADSGSRALSWRSWSVAQLEAAAAHGGHHANSYTTHGPLRRGRTPALCAAIRLGRTDIVAKLLAGGADPNAEETRGFLGGNSSPCYALAAHDERTSALLLANGARLNENCVLAMAMRRGGRDALLLLLQSGRRVHADVLDECFTSLVHASLDAAAPPEEVSPNLAFLVAAGSNFTGSAYDFSAFCGDARVDGGRFWSRLLELRRAGDLQLLLDSGFGSFVCACDVRRVALAMDDPELTLSLLQAQAPAHALRLLSDKAACSFAPKAGKQMAAGVGVADACAGKTGQAAAPAACMVVNAFVAKASKAAAAAAADTSDARINKAKQLAAEL
jgi:hypothetical protein